MYAQNNGKITGTVVDSQTGESLIGVNVVIEGTIKGTATDIDGRYTIRNVEPGNLHYRSELPFVCYSNNYQCSCRSGANIDS